MDSSDTAACFTMEEGSEFDEDAYVEMYIAGSDAVGLDKSVAVEMGEMELNLRRSSSRYFDPNEAQFCHNCGEEGHIARNCITPAKSDAVCFFCGEAGHMQNDCEVKREKQLKERTGDLKECRICFRHGHTDRECYNKRRRAEMDAMVDGIVGSVLKKQTLRYCPNCGAKGHDMAGCRSKLYEEDYVLLEADKKKPQKGGDMECFLCGKKGHARKNCPKSVKGRRESDGDLERERDFSCFLCGQAGHIQKNCPQGREVKRSTSMRDLSRNHRDRRGRGWSSSEDEEDEMGFFVQDEPPQSRRSSSGGRRVFRESEDSRGGSSGRKTREDDSYSKQRKRRR